MDVVVNLAFGHDFSKFAENAAAEIKASEAVGSVLEPGKLLVVTSGVGLTSGAPGHVRTESDPPVDSPMIPRRPEQAAQAVAAKGVHVAIVAQLSSAPASQKSTWGLLHPPRAQCFGGTPAYHSERLKASNTDGRKCWNRVFAS